MENENHLQIYERNMLSIIYDSTIPKMNWQLANLVNCPNLGHFDMFAFS